MALSDRFQHTMRVVRTAATGVVIEGQRDEKEEFSSPVRCLLTTAPRTKQGDAAGRRSSQGPTLLCAPVDAAGSVLGLKPEVVVEVTAPGVHLPQGLRDPTRYQVESVQPLQRPGSPPMGFNVALVDVKD